MTYIKINEITIEEAIALAFAQFGYDRFDASKLTSHLCGLFQEKLTVKTVNTVVAILADAKEKGLLQSAPGPRGGPGFKVSRQGVQELEDIELPQGKLDCKEKRDGELSHEANANPAPIFDRLLKLIPEGKYRERKFIQDLKDHWITKGRLSQKQVASLEKTAERWGEYIAGHHYVGTAMIEWREPYLKERKQREQEHRATLKAYKAAAESERLAAEQRRAQTKKTNSAASQTLRKMDAEGCFQTLPALVHAVFPGTIFNEGAKVRAFAGSGSREVRVCVAALAFGKPPNEIWMKSGTGAQPDQASPHWQTLISHPAYVPHCTTEAKSNDII
jgi:hypothetical protein